MKILQFKNVIIFNTLDIQAPEKKKKKIFYTNEKSYLFHCYRIIKHRKEYALVRK